MIDIASLRARLSYCEGVIEAQKLVIADLRTRDERHRNLRSLPQKRLSASEKDFWEVAQDQIREEKPPEKLPNGQPNEKGLIRIDLTEAAQLIGVSDGSTGRLLKNITERFDATREVVEYKKQNGQKIHLTYINPSDQIWEDPQGIHLPSEKERKQGGDHRTCKCGGEMRKKHRTIQTQEYWTCEACKTMIIYPPTEENAPWPSNSAESSLVDLAEIKGFQLENLSADLPEESAEDEDETDDQADESQGFQVENLPPVPAEEESKVFKSEDLTVDTVGVETEHMEPPMELQELKQWVVWRYEKVEGKEKPAKVPYQAKRGRSPQMAKTNDANTWGTYEEARAKYEEAIRWNMKERWEGIGFVFNNDYTGIDYDHCITDNVIDALAWERIKATWSYSEVSPSGTGIKSIVKGTIPGGRHCSDIEMYDHCRFFTFTGNHLKGTPTTIEARQQELTILHKEISPADKGNSKKPPMCIRVACDHERTAKELEEAGKLILQKASNAANKGKFCALWDGEIIGYKSQSEADLALCRLLAYWTDYDEVMIDYLFRQSSLYRQKWDSAARQGETYGEGTIRLAQNQQEEETA
jgi:hypothetical protein